MKNHHRQGGTDLARALGWAIRSPRVLGTAVLLLLGAYLIYLFAGEFQEIRSLEQRIVEVEREIEAVQLRNDDLQRTVARLDEPGYIEQVAREELGLVKPGETRYVIQEVPADSLK